MDKISKDKIEKPVENGIKCLLNIKSKIILKKIFDNILKKKFLEIIKYNNKLKERINLTFNDYKNYSQKYTTIEIEIIPVKNLNTQYSIYRFININKNEVEYFHIYFDDSKIKIKRTYITPFDKVNKIKIIINYQVKSFYLLFQYCTCIESINFIKFYRNNIYSMSYMFDYCQSLKEINFYSFNTENVTDMSCMFKECSLLKKLDLSKFNTKNVTNMGHLFFDCCSLEYLNISSFNTVKVTNMSFMFNECKSLKELNVSSFNTGNVTDMRDMFWGCSSLKELNISNFNTAFVCDMKGMFDECSDKLISKIKDKNKNIRDEAFIPRYQY